MSRTCTICAHADRERIDSALLGSESNRAIASQFGLTRSAVQRHAENHIPEALAKAKEAESIAKADTLLEQVQRAQARVLGWLDAAEKDKDRRSLAPLSKELRGYFGLMGQLTGQLANGTNVNVSVSNMPSPAAAGGPSQSFEHLDAVTIADALLAELAPGTLAQVARLLLEATSLDATGELSPDRENSAPAALGPAGPAPANLSVETHSTNSSKLVPDGATPAQSLFQPGRMPGT